MILDADDTVGSPGLVSRAALLLFNAASSTPENSVEYRKLCVMVLVSSGAFK